MKGCADSGICLRLRCWSQEAPTQQDLPVARRAMAVRQIPLGQADPEALRPLPRETVPQRWVRVAMVASETLEEPGAWAVAALRQPQTARRR